MSDDDTSAATSSSSRISVISYPMDEYSRMLEKLNHEDTPLLIINRTAKRRMLARGKKIELKSFASKEILPLSGHRIIVKESADDCFQFSTNITNIEGPIEGFERDDIRKIELDSKESTLFLASLRLSQLMLKAHQARTSNGEEQVIVLSRELVDLLEVLENFMAGESDRHELLKSYIDLQGYATGRLSEFSNQLEKEGLLGSVSFTPILISQDWFDQPVDSSKESPLLEPSFERKYVSLASEKEDIDPNEYLAKSPDDEVSTYIKEVLFNSLASLFLLPTPKSERQLVEVVQPRITLRIEIDEKTDPYLGVIELANKILPAIEGSVDNSEPVAKNVKQILEKSKQENNLRKLINDAPDTLMVQLEQIIENHNLESVMKLELSEKVSGVLKYELSIEGKTKSVRIIFGETIAIRGRIASISNSLNKLLIDIESLGSGRDSNSDVADLLPKWKKLLERLATLKSKEQSLDKALTDVNKIQTDLKVLERKLKTKSSMISTDESILWLGLGQAGGQILRECLLYALDNLNDARCSALVSALGLKDQKVLNDHLLNRRSQDPTEVEKAESELIEECHRNLHVLAMNLGGEIDALVSPDQPGYFLWGSDVQESENTSVRRKRRNTIKLDIDQDGAGGKTGIGRAFGFARQSEIIEALRDVGQKRDRTPKHIIVTHSFAGGSGSGLVLPVLQMLRKIFDSETMIWVISVGQGKSEERESASFNTPFILSDILQAHYDGIHSPMDPFNFGEWEQIIWELNDGHSEMNKELGNLGKVIGAFEDGVEFMDYFDNSDYGKKLYERKRNHLSRDRNIKSSISSNENTYWSKKEDLPTKTDILNHTELINLLPKNESSTRAFNDWCTEYNQHGRRPSLDFWYDWIESISDPLGTRLSGLVKTTKITAGNDKEESSRNFVPSLTGTHLDAIFERLRFTVFTSESSSDSTSNDKKKFKPIPELEPLKNLFADKLMQVEESERETLFNEYQKICQAYSTHLDNYNKIRREITIRVQALSKSSNDLGIKNIIISNAHLERGVEASGIPVEEKSYTVFNAVVFDFIVNIIGSQLPSHNYISGKMEYFDKQDLSNHTKPPMVVGLLEQNDSLSLEDTVHASSRENLYQKAQGLFYQIFLSESIMPGQINPFYAGNEARSVGLRATFNSFMGIRMTYLLQHNPYQLMSQEEPEMLKELTVSISEQWPNPESVIYGQDFDQRESIKKDLGFSGWNMANMIRWVSCFELDTLKSILGGNFKLNKESLDGYFLPQTPQLDLKHARTASSISGFESSSGQVNIGALSEILPKLGIWTEDILAAHSPSFLTSYLIGPLLEMATRAHSNSPDNSDSVSTGYLNILADLHLNPDTSFTDEGSSKGLEDALVMWTELLPSEDKQAIEGALNAYDLQIIDKLVDQKPFMTLRLHPRLHRFLNAIRDSVKGPGVSILPARSMSASISRYLSPDVTNEEIGEFSAPLFTRALDLMNKNRYVGLLPDERFFNWSVLLRILLLGDVVNARIFIDKLQHLAKANGIDLEQFEADIEECLQHQYSKSHFTVYSDPQTVCEQASILVKRIVSSKNLTSRFAEKYPHFADSTTEWLRIVESNWEEGTTPDDVEEFNPGTLRFISHVLQIELSRISNSDASSGENADEPVSEFNIIDTRTEGVLQVQRLLFEILTNLNEALTQSEYISKDASTERVRFQMSGFSDRIHGQPSGLLVQVHTDSSYRGDNDQSVEAMRDSIYASIDKVSDSKEFFTKSFFGPRASVTTSLQQAPISEASTTFRRVIGHLGGYEPESYLEKTKLHPYVFLYNILWLSAKINVWCKGNNNLFAKNFIIPTAVIEQHYSNPGSLHGSAQSLVTDSVFQNGIEVPRDDLRDFENAGKPGETYRSMGRLIGIMVLRHIYASKEHRKFIGEGPDSVLPQRIFKVLESDKILQKFAQSYRGDSLVASSAVVSKKSTDSSALAALKAKLAGLKKENPSGNEKPDTLESRTIAWLKAYKAWFEYSNPRSNDQLSALLDAESSLQDDLN